MVEPEAEAIRGQEQEVSWLGRYRCFLVLICTDYRFVFEDTYSLLTKKALGVSLFPQKQKCLLTHRRVIQLKSMRGLEVTSAAAGGGQELVTAVF